MRDTHLPTFVYGLVDPRWCPPEGLIFYVGITISPGYRLYTHRHDPCSVAWQRIREIEVLSGYETEMNILAEFANRQDAFDLEHRLICTLPNLVNRDKRRFRVHNYAGAA